MNDDSWKQKIYVYKFCISKFIAISNLVSILSEIDGQRYHAPQYTNRTNNEITGDYCHCHCRDIKNLQFLFSHFFLPFQSRITSTVSNTIFQCIGLSCLNHTILLHLKDLPLPFSNLCYP